MAVSVRIEDEAFSDRRYDVLALVLGLPDADCARGKMASVWRQCTQQQTHVLSAEIVRAILGENGPDALLKSGLGEPSEGGIRICGTRGRIEWLSKLRKNARKGGYARSAKRQPNGKPNGSHLAENQSANWDPKSSPPVPAPVTVTVSSSGERTIPRRGRPKGQVGPMPEGWAPNQAHRELATAERLDLDRECAKFTAHHTAHGNRFADWDAAFRNWLIKSAEFRGDRQDTPAPQQTFRRIEEL